MLSAAVSLLRLRICAHSSVRLHRAPASPSFPSVLNAFASVAHAVTPNGYSVNPPRKKRNGGSDSTDLVAVVTGGEAAGTRVAGETARGGTTPSGISDHDHDLVESHHLKFPSFSVAMDTVDTTVTSYVAGTAGEQSRVGQTASHRPDGAGPGNHGNHATATVRRTRKRILG